jgi:hypothetical protein
MISFSQGKYRTSLKLAWVILALSLSRPLALLSQVFSAPISDKVVDARLTLEGKEVSFSLLEGSIATIRDEDNGESFGLLPSIDLGAQKIRFGLFSIERTKPSGERRISEVGRLELQIGSAAPIQQLERPILLQVEAVRKTRTQVDPKEKKQSDQEPNPDSTSSLEVRKVLGTSGGGMCCVICGSITVCANHVQMHCGSCGGGDQFSKSY